MDTCKMFAELINAVTTLQEKLSLIEAENKLLKEDVAALMKINGEEFKLDFKSVIEKVNELDDKIEDLELKVDTLEDDSSSHGSDIESLFDSVKEFDMDEITDSVVREIKSRL